VAAQTPNRVLNTIYFGGGTPSLMSPDTVGAVIEAARHHWPGANDMEITLEANPGSVEAARLAGYRDAGVNRISLGIQALEDDDLRALGRIHTVAEARAALDIANACFERVSFDLIYARQNQTPGQWRNELQQALSMGADHLSLYQLTIESGTAFGDRYALGRLRGLPDDDLSADMYQITRDLCEAHGFPAYEVSNHARPGLESRHNLIYWRYGDYIGIGPGAHGRITIDGQRFATQSQPSPEGWLQAVAKGSGEIRHQPLDGLEQAEEYLMMGLRIREGISTARYRALCGKELNREARNSLRNLGMIKDTGDRIIVTKQGVMLLNAITSELLTG